MDFFFLLIRCAHKEFRVPSFCRRIFIHIYFLIFEIKKDDSKSSTSFVLLKVLLSSFHLLYNVIKACLILFRLGKGNDTSITVV